MGNVLYSILTMSCFVFLTFTITGQSLSPNVFSNGGSVQSQMSYTIGEPLILTISSENNLLTQGFHQTYLDIVSVEENTQDIVINVFPNPTRNELNFSFPDELVSIQVRIFDAQGKLIRTRQVVKNSPIQLADFARGFYTVVVDHPQLKFPKHFSIIRS